MQTPQTIPSRSSTRSEGPAASLFRKRILAGISLREAAFALGIDASYLSKLERGLHSPNRVTLMKINEYLRTLPSKRKKERKARRTRKK